MERINRSLDWDKIHTKRDFFESLEKFLGRTPTNAQAEAFLKTDSTQKRFETGNLFKKAGGKDLERDRLRTHPNVLTRPSRYIVVTAQRSDLIGLDTSAKRFGFTTVEGKRVRRLIDISRTRVVEFKPTYQRKVKSGVIIVRRKVLQQIYIFSKQGKRLRFKK